MSEIYLGYPQDSIKQWIIDHAQPANDKLRLVVETTADYKKSGIYSAERDDTSKPVVIDWGDGTIEQVNEDISQKVHTYSTIGTFNVIVENIKSYAASASNQTWRETTSQNRYTLKEVVSVPDSVTGIGDNAFFDCNGLTSVTIPNSVTSIGSEAFGSCSGLTSVTIPDSVTSIGNRGFAYCYSIKNVIIPNSVTSIGGSAFINSGLRSVTIGNSVTSIGDSAFGHCGGLTSVTIPNSVTSIGGYAFQFCSGLTSIIFEGKTLAEVQAMNPSYWFELYATPRRNVTITCANGSFIVTVSCFIKGTDILLADNTTKKIEDLAYDDVLKVWDFDEGHLGSAKVCWLTRPGLKSNHYYQLTFDNGTVLKTTGINSNHRIFSVDQSKFTNVCDAKVGDKVFSIDGTLTITDVQYIEEECEYYNVMTSGKINCFANGILTSDRYGNLYPIVDMKYVKDGRTIRPYSEYEAVGIDKYWYDNLRLGENTETVEKSKEYVWKCLGQMLPLPNNE